MTNLQPLWIVGLSIYLLCSSIYELGDNFCNCHNGAAAGLRWRSWRRQGRNQGGQLFWRGPKSMAKLDGSHVLDYFVKKVVYEISKSGHGPPSSFAMDFGSLQRRNNIFSLHFPNFCDYFVKKVVSIFPISVIILLRK